MKDAAAKYMAEGLGKEEAYRKAYRNHAKQKLANAASLPVQERIKLEERARRLGLEVDSSVNREKKPEAKMPDAEQRSESGINTGKYQVGAYQDIKGVKDLDAHHVGQKALMKKLVADYDELTAPAINVPKLGHTKRHPERGIVSRSTKGITNARQLLARDLFELKRVYPDIPNSALRN